MAKEKDDFHKVSKRVHFSKYFKRRALLEFSRLKKPNEALEACGLVLDEELKKDKKYAAKLLHKWRKEMYANHTMLNVLNYELTDEVLKNEIEYISATEDKTDKLMEKIESEIKEYKKFKRNKAEYLHKLLKINTNNRTKNT